MKVRDIDIRDIGLSNRSMNALSRSHIETIGDLLDIPKDQIAYIRNIGAKSLEEIYETIEKYSKIAENTVDNKSDDFTDEGFDIDSWVLSTEGRLAAQLLFVKENTKIDVLTDLPTKTYNCLLFNDLNDLSELVLLSPDELRNVPRMDEDSIDVLVNLEGEKKT